MPDLSTVSTRLTCASCGTVSDAPNGEVRFQWGKVPTMYRQGQAIQWAKSSDGGVLPPFLYQQVKGRFEWNCGTPDYVNVIVLDSDPMTPTVTCPGCGAPFKAIGVEILQGVIQKGLGFSVAAFAEFFGAPEEPFDIALRQENGTWSPRPDWYDVAVLPFEGVQL